MSRSNQKQSITSPANETVTSNEKNIYVNHFQLDPQPIQYEKIQNTNFLEQIEAIPIDDIK